MNQAQTNAENRGASALAFLMLYWALIAPASALYYAGIKGLHSTLITFALVVIIGVTTNKRIRVGVLFVVASLVSLSFVNALHWDDLRYLFYWVFFVCALILVEVGGAKAIHRFCIIGTGFIIVLLIGALLSFLIAFSGISPAFAITNPDGQDYYFYYTGFTNSISGDLIRASAIYDEPGAFSMYICFVAALRHLLERDRRTTWMMLALGFVTLSLAHLIYVFCHFLAEQSSKARIAIFLTLLVCSLTLLSTSINPDSNIVLLSRLALTEDTNLFAGDNRSFQFLNALGQISDNPSSIYFGLDNTCVFNQAICQEKFGSLGENPLSPLAFGGLLSETPYYIAILLLFLSPAFGKRYIVLFGIGLLFLQRPYVMGFSYSLIALVLIDLMLRRNLKQMKTNDSLRNRHRPNSGSMTDLLAAKSDKAGPPTALRVT